MQVSEQIFTLEARLDTLVKESKVLFLNGPTPLETTEEIIDKVEDTRKAIQYVKKNFELFVNRAWSEVPSLEITIDAQAGGSGMSHQ